MATYIKLREEEYGKIGKEIIPYNNRHKKLHIGDLVLYNTENGKGSEYNYHAGVIVEEPSGCISIFGWCGLDITKQCRTKVLEVIVPYHELTEGILKHKHSDHLKIVEVEEVPMTLEEIEEALGHKIKLVTE